MEGTLLTADRRFDVVHAESSNTDGRSENQAYVNAMKATILSPSAKIRLRWIAAGAGLLVFASGCGEKRVNVWTPQPLVHWNHLSAQPLDTVYNGYRIMAPRPTRGLFPASLVVTRLGVELSDAPAEATHVFLLADPRNELLRWNRALDDQMAISEVFPVVERDLGGWRADPEQILATFRALEAQLGLIYGVNELTDTESEMIGVLYDIKSQQPLATFHTRAVSVVPREKKRNGKPADLWETDCRALVRKQFERFVHACIRELILHDEPETVEAAAGWMTADPPTRAEWPPQAARTDRGPPQKRP